MNQFVLFPWENKISLAKTIQSCLPLIKVMFQIISFTYGSSV